MSTVAQITIRQYDRMIAKGVFDGPSRQRVELIYGELRMLSPIGPTHEDVVDELVAWSVESVSLNEIRLRIQQSVGLPALTSVPEPDVAWVRYQRYHKARPKAEDVLLLIEAARSSLRYDLGEKALLYAKARIADYWVVNLRRRCVVVFRDPFRGKYRSTTEFEIDDKIHPLAFPRVTLSVARLFS